MSKETESAVLPLEPELQLRVLPLEPDVSWEGLVGKVVELRQGGHLIRRAEVELVAPDSNILWLRSEGIEGRRMVVRGDGHHLSIVAP